MYMKIIAAVGIGFIIYHSYNVMYREPMLELERDKAQLLDIENEVNKSIKVSKEFEDNMSIQKMIIWKTNEKIQIKDVGTDFSPGNHTLTF